MVRQRPLPSLMLKVPLARALRVRCPRSRGRLNRNSVDADGNVGAGEIRTTRAVLELEDGEAPPTRDLLLL